MNFVIYGDFASPESYLASRRVDALLAAGAQVQWRAVEGEPGLPVTGRPLGSAQIEEQIRRLGGLLLKDETLPWSAPAIVPNTQAAVAGYAEGYEAGVGADVRRLVFAAYWVEGLNIGSADVLWPRLAGAIMRGRSASYALRESGYAIAVSRTPVTLEAARRVREWRADWHDLGAPTLPALIVDGGLPVVGETALRELEKELLRLGAPVDPALPDPGRYPSVSLRPDPYWVSQIGGRWANVWKNSA